MIFKIYNDINTKSVSECSILSCISVCERERVRESFNTHLRVSAQVGPGNSEMGPDEVIPPTKS